MFIYKELVISEVEKRSYRDPYRPERFLCDNFRK